MASVTCQRLPSEAINGSVALCAEVARLRKEVAAAWFETVTARAMTAQRRQLGSLRGGEAARPRPHLPPLGEKLVVRAGGRRCIVIRDALLCLDRVERGDRVRGRRGICDFGAESSAGLTEPLAWRAERRGPRRRACFRRRRAAARRRATSGSV